MTLLYRATRFALVLALAVRANAQSSIDRSPGTVSILRDDWGVPHIFAAREEDGYFGLGYALAEDRLENVLRRYVAANSGLASIFGRDSLAKDLGRLQWMHMEAARNALRRFSPQLRRDYESFAEGIEQFMRDNPSRVPRWARNMRIDPALPIAWSRAWAFHWAEGVEECAAGGAPVNQQLLSAARDEGRAMPASNGWVVSPWRSEEGAAVLVGDSHSEFSGNGEMFEFHLDAGDIKVTGTSGVGVPWVIVGHTRAAAWTTTNRGYDGADCYVLQVHASNPRRYMHSGVWRTMQTREVSVRVKESAPISHVFEYVEVNGLLNPVVARRGTQVWVVSDPYMDRGGRLDEQMYAHLRARSVADIKAAHAVQEMWPTNLLVADSAGNILYIRTGRIPVRPPGPDWTRPLDGATRATEWRGIHPLADLVQAENPPIGFMQNNNVSPDVMFPGSHMTFDRFAPEVYGERPGNANFRGRRATELLSRLFQATVADHLAILFDEKWEAADAFTEGVRQALTRQGPYVRSQSREFRQLAQRLAEFDGYASQSSTAALTYLYWRRAMSENPSANQQLVRMTLRDSVPSAAFDSVLLTAIARAGQLLREDFGTVDRTFGDVFRVGRGGTSYSLGGFVGTMRSMVYGPRDSTGQHWVRAGQRQPLVVTFSRPVRSFSSLNFGQSNEPSSPHYADQSRLMSEKRLKPTYFNEQELLPHVESRKALKRQSK